MIVHPDEAGDDAVATQVEDLRAGWDRRSGAADLIDLPSHDDDRGVIASRGAGAIDHAHVREREDRRVDANEGANVGGKRLRCDRCLLYTSDAADEEDSVDL